MAENPLALVDRALGYISALHDAGTGVIALNEWLVELRQVIVDDELDALAEAEFTEPSSDAWLRVVNTHVETITGDKNVEPTPERLSRLLTLHKGLTGNWVAVTREAGLPEDTPRHEVIERVGQLRREGAPDAMRTLRTRSLARALGEEENTPWESLVLKARELQQDSATEPDRGPIPVIKRCGTPEEVAALTKDSDEGNFVLPCSPAGRPWIGEHVRYVERNMIKSPLAFGAPYEHVLVWCLNR